MSIELLLSTCENCERRVNYKQTRLFAIQSILKYTQTYHFHIIKHYTHIFSEKSLIKSKIHKRTHNKWEHDIHIWKFDSNKGLPGLIVNSFAIFVRFQFGIIWKLFHFRNEAQLTKQISVWWTFVMWWHWWWFHFHRRCIGCVRVREREWESVCLADEWAFW